MGPKARPRGIIARAMRFDLSQARALYAQQHGSGVRQARLVERELKRYLVLRALHPKTRYGMAGPVDEFWHTFLLFTREYSRFCAVVAGRFLHHEPGVHQTNGHLGQFQQDYASLWRDYPAVFGEPPSSSVWPTLQDIRLECQKRRRRLSAAR